MQLTFLHRPQSPIYILATAGLIGSLFQAFLYTAYLGPSGIVQSFLIADNVESFYVKLLGCLFHVLWIYDLLMQVAIAANRTIIVVLPHMHKLLSRTFTIGMTFLALLLAIIVATAANYGPYCCSFYLNYVTFSYSFVSRALVFNTANFFIDLPVNIICSIACVVFYVIIYTHIRGSTKKIHSSMGDRAAQARNSRELKIAFQFFICSGTYISIWITFRIASYYITREYQELKVILTLLHIFHCTANSVVFLIFNKDIRRGFFNVFLKPQPVSTTSACSESSRSTNR
uniref:7TM_GPCR_Srx domain-containing protein n=1 Tax=Panagrellus redivivus TaxID=6233 RepID=A0A7E4ZRE8_PANRE